MQAVELARAIAASDLDHPVKIEQLRLLRIGVADNSTSAADAHAARQYSAISSIITRLNTEAQRPASAAARRPILRRPSMHSVSSSRQPFIPPAPPIAQRPAYSMPRYEIPNYIPHTAPATYTHQTTYVPPRYEIPNCIAPPAHYNGRHHQQGPWMPGSTLPYGTGMHILLHPQLAVNPVEPRCPQIRWNIAHNPTSARFIQARGVYGSKPNFSADATAPATTAAYITIEHPILGPWMAHWGPIFVSKSKSVKIADIMQAIYEYFQKQLTEQEFSGLDNRYPGVAKSTIMRMVNARIAESTELPMVEWRKGVLRIDLLGPGRVFGGLTLKTFSDNTFQMLLHLSY